jgi:hypothetical protein
MCLVAAGAPAAGAGRIAGRAEAGRRAGPLGAALLAAAAAGCSGGSSDAAYTIGGTVAWSGAGAPGLVLAAPGQPDLAVGPGEGTFRFPNRVRSGTLYDVRVAAQPIPGGCAVAGGYGFVPGADVASIAVTCDGRLVAGDLRTPNAFYFTATGLADGRVLVAGGHTGSSAIIIGTAELFDPRTGTWAPAAPMTAPRASACAVLLPSGKVLVAGGVRTSWGDSLDTAETYDPGTDAWTSTAGTMAIGRDLPACALLASGKVLIAGGLLEVVDDGVPPRASRTAEIYDPDTGTFAATGSMATARYWHTATLLPGGQVLVTGGCSPGGYPCLAATASAEVYDPATGEWSETGPLPAPVFAHTATRVAAPGLDAVLVSGGCPSDPQCGPEGTLLGSPEARVSLYDPLSGTFAAAGTLSTGRVGHVAIPLGGSQVLLLGGTTGDAGARTTDVCDASTGTCAPGSLTAIDHGSYLGAAQGRIAMGGGCTCGYWLAIGGLGPRPYEPLASTEGGWLPCECPLP